MGVSLMFVGVRQQNGCFDTHTFIQFSTYEKRCDGIAVVQNVKTIMCQKGDTLPLTLAPLGGGKGPPLWFFANSS